MKANYSIFRSRGSQWATALSAIAISLITGTASTKDEVPQKAKETSQIISSHTNDDDSVDNISMVVGVATHLGRYTAMQHTHILPWIYDPASHSLIYSFTFTRTLTAANGDTWESTGAGTTIVPLDAGFNALPPPCAFFGAYQQAGGSVFQGTFQGLDFGDGTGSGTWAGTTRSRGAQKK